MRYALQDFIAEIDDVRKRRTCPRLFVERPGFLLSAFLVRRFVVAEEVDNLPDKPERNRKEDKG